MIQPEENNDDNPIFHLEIKKDHIAPVQKTVKPLYRIGNRLLSSDEWIVHQNEQGAKRVNLTTPAAAVAPRAHKARRPKSG